MPTRPQVPGWNNINLNKPNEYSSEFTIDGIRYANVTNVTTGQRQLYVVQPPLNRRELVISTNANGEVERGSYYNTYIQFQGQEKLRTADRENKKQSIFIIRRASTEKEKESLGNTREYRSLRNNTSGNEDGNELLSRIVFDTRNISQGSPLKDIAFICYPTDIAETKQDRIKFTAATLKERTLSSPADYEKIDRVGDVYISIQGSITDQNAASWGEDDAPAAKIAMGEIAKGGVDKAQELLSSAMKDVKDQNSKDAILAAAAAGEMGLFTRATQQVFNPNIELLFNKPQLRSFSFNFKMSARSPTEASAIKKIINFFKYHSAVKDTEGFLFLKSPDVFWIEYQKGNKLHPSLNLIAPSKVKKKACALQNMSVSYTPLGRYMTFDDEEATMVQYDLTLSFQDITPLYQSDYDEMKDHPIGY